MGISIVKAEPSKPETVKRTTNTEIIEGKCSDQADGC